MADKNGVTRYDRAPKFFGKGRTRFDLSHTILTTGNTGDLIPILVEPVVPGSTMSLKTASLTRLETSLHQTMDNAYVETAYFFVPSRCLWTNFDKYQGFNKDAWAQTLDFKKPQIQLCGYVDDEASLKIKPQSLLNYLGVPACDLPNNENENGWLEIDQLPLRAVYKIWNDWFRDTNIDSEIYYDDGDSDIDMTDPVLLNGKYFYPNRETLKVNRFKDMFSTVLPQPQKGDPVSISFGDSAPVIVSNENGAGYLSPYPGSVQVSASGAVPAGSSKSLLGSKISGQTTEISGPILADLTDVNFTVNDLRIAIALQSMRERDARSGNRLNEKLYGTWHIETNSLELDKSEFLGGKRIPVNMVEVLQTSETNNTVLGSDAGHSKTFDADDSFVRTFTQWGYVVGFVFVRTSRSYSQGIDRKLICKDILDEYDPMLDNIGEMPVRKYELSAMYYKGSGGFDNINDMKEVFGYQEAWYWYKERTNRYSGYFQNAIQGTLSSWHYGDEYWTTDEGEPVPTVPMLSPDWLKEGPENVDRTIAVTSEAPLGYQWMFNIHFDLSNTFEASKYSIPNTFGF